MQTLDRPPAPGSLPFPVDRLDPQDVDFGDAATRTEWPSPLPASRLLLALLEQGPKREASRRLPEAISAH